MKLLGSELEGSRPFALKNQIEAILYLKGQPLDVASLAELADCKRDEAYDAVLELMEDYAHRDSALEVLALPEGFALQLRPPFLPLVSEILPPELGVGSLRTLAMIILRGPLSQADLVELRGPSAYQQVADLVEKGFVTKYRQAGSRSAWLKVTNKFHHYFSVNELASVHAQIMATPDVIEPAAATDPFES
ncbi:MAG: SMC-Scp complex subunit ScpB [Cyanobacteriota bacterium]|nr:SMC-Scp complex subunit ScpB [Cyanobacteriota bacterium]